MKYDFERDLHIGKKFEALFIQHLKALGVPSNWINQAPNCKFDDWDIKVTLPSGTIFTYEIKRDFHIKRTGNICFELWSSLERRIQGWGYLSQADKMVIFYSDTEFMVFDYKTIKDCARRYNACYFDSARKQIQQASGEHTVFLLFPFTDIDREYGEVKVCTQ